MEEFILVVPAYRPSEALIDVVDSLKPIEDRIKVIVCVNDGSGSEYDNVFSKLSSYHKCHVLEHRINQGKGRALKTAFEYIINEFRSSKEAVITIDADGQHDVNSIIRVMDAYDGGNNLILGSRDFSKTSTGEKVPFKSRVGNGITKGVFKYLCGIKLMDTQTGLRLYPMAILEEMLSVVGEKYEYETNVLLNCKDKSIPVREVLIETIYEDNNSCSHFRPVADSILIYKVIIKYTLSSGLAVIIDNSVFFALSVFMTNVYLMTLISRGCSAGINFAVNRKAVFNSQDNVVRQAAQYALLVVISGPISATFVSVLSRWINLPIIIFKLVVESGLFFFNFYIQKFVIFRKRSTNTI